MNILIKSSISLYIVLEQIDEFLIFFHSFRYRNSSVIRLFPFQNNFEDLDPDLDLRDFLADNPS